MAKMIPDKIEAAAETALSTQNPKQGIALDRKPEGEGISADKKEAAPKKKLGEKLKEGAKKALDSIKEDPAKAVGRVSETLGPALRERTNMQRARQAVPTADDERLMGEPVNLAGAFDL